MNFRETQKVLEAKLRDLKCNLNFFSRILTFMWVQTTQFTEVVHSHNKVEAAASKETTFPFLTIFSPIGMSAKKSLVILPKSLPMSGPSIVMAFLTSLAMRMTNCFPISTKSMAISFPQGHQTLKLKVNIDFPMP